VPTGDDDRGFMIYPQRVREHIYSKSRELDLAGTYKRFLSPELEQEVRGFFGMFESLGNEGFREFGLTAASL